MRSLDGCNRNQYDRASAFPRHGAAKRVDVRCNLDRLGQTGGLMWFFIGLSVLCLLLLLRSSFRKKSKKRVPQDDGILELIPGGYKQTYPGGTVLSVRTVTPEDQEKERLAKKAHFAQMFADAPEGEWVYPGFDSSLLDWLNGLVEAGEIEERRHLVDTNVGVLQHPTFKDYRRVPKA